MGEVSCRSCAPIVETIHSRGLSADEIVRGLPFSFAYLSRPSHRIDWDDFTVLLERIAELLGGSDELETMASSYYTGSTGVLSAFASNFVSAKPIYLLGARWYGPSLFSSTRARCEELDGGRILQEIEILPSYRDSELFFHSMRGALRAVPAMLGQPNAAVEMEVHPRHAVYAITPPPSLTVWSRLRRVLRREQAIDGALDELSIHAEEVMKSHDDVRRANRRLNSQSHQLDALQRLGPELLRHTAIDPLADALIASLEESVEVRGVALWLAQGEGDAFERIRVRGDVADRPTRQDILRAGGHTVGRLDLWLPTEGRESPNFELLDGLLPWITLALDNARSGEALGRQSQRLAEEIRRRERAQLDLRQARDVDAIGRLAAGIAHELNNSLAAVGGYAELVRERLDKEDPAHSDVDAISRLSVESAALVRQIPARLGGAPATTVPVDANEVVLGLERTLRGLLPGDFELQLDVSEDPCWVMAEPGELDRAILECVTQRCAALPRGARITIATSRVAFGDLARGLRTAIQHRRFVQLVLRDSGRAPNPAAQLRAARDTDPTSDRMTEDLDGIWGLQEIAARTGGTVERVSESPAGRSIRVDLPEVDEPPPELQSLELERDVAGGSELLLLVDTDEHVRAVASRILESKGYSVLAAATGAQALALCEAYAEAIRLLISDTTVPGMSGRELAKRVAAQCVGLRGTLYLAEDTEVPGQTTDDPGPPARTLPKPFGSTALLTAVRARLDA